MCVLVTLSVLAEKRREEKPHPVAQKNENALPNINSGNAGHTKHTKSDGQTTVSVHIVLANALDVNVQKDR